MPPSSHACPHKDLLLDVSPFAKEVGFTRVHWERRLAAAKPSGRAPSKKHLAEEEPEDGVALAFPGPLVLPDDELALDPKSPPQTLRSFIQENERNKITRKRQTIYVAAPFEIDDKVSFVDGWSRPLAGGKKRSPTSHTVPPLADDVKEYLSAFYHGLPVVDFSTLLRLVAWEEEAKKGEEKKTSRKNATSKAPSSLGLQTNTGITRIQVRPCPDEAFSYQLNLSDILDAAIEMLPDDAYAIILLAHQDLYEDDDDDFCCGRAFGGSRVSVVSTARYHPALDVDIGIDLAHMWPASHCKSYTDSMLDPGIRRKPRNADEDTPGPLRAAVDAAKAIGTTDLHGLWFSRVCRTASHELGHCMGIDHCVHFACVMQGTAGMGEDVRQPPYLCPVCMSKLSRSIAAEFRGMQGEAQYVRERHMAMLKVCERWQQVPMFAGFGAWIDAQLPSTDESMDIS